MRARLITIVARPVAVAIGLVAFSNVPNSMTNSTQAADRFEYPHAEKQDVVDDYHGTRVEDPYRWLEDPESEATRAWVEKENTLTRSFVDAYPARAAIVARLRSLWNYERFTLPRKEANRYFFSRNDGLQDQYVLYMQDALDAEPRMILDPNALSDDGTVALSDEFYSFDSKLLAYAVSRSGSDWQEIRIRNVDIGEEYPETLERCKFSYVAWKQDGTGFWYNRYPDEDEVAPEDRNSFNRVYWHTLGTPQSEDRLVFEDPAHKDVGFWPYATSDGAYLALLVYKGTDPRNGIYIRSADSDGDFTRLLSHDEAKFELVDNLGATFYFVTDLDAPRGRIIAIDLDNPDRGQWREVVSESEKVIDFAVMSDKKLVLAVMVDARHELEIYEADGTFDHVVELPALGAVEKLRGRSDDAELFISFESFVYPATKYLYNLRAKNLTAFRASKLDIDLSRYETTQVFYSSKDGTRVPMFLIHRKGMKQDGTNPTWLYGYGGFNISLTPWFSISRLLWLESGGVYAVANIRGGEEYGEEWHQRGILDRKQNVFDDFIAAAEYLIKENYTSRDQLVINGGSNGGLLVAACMVQRPDLFGAVVCQVPVIDMLRYHKFTVGKYWVSDYGNAEDGPEQFEYLHAYSPLHNVEPGVTYPATLITSADTDDRVVPAHAKKFAAALQEADSGTNPLLLRVDVRAGHGAGKPTSKIIEEYADILAFVFRVLGVDPTTLPTMP